MTSAAPADDILLEPTGAFRGWLAHFDLLDLWHQTAELPTKRADYFKGQLLRAYLTERRRAERSARFQLSRAR